MSMQLFCVPHAGGSASSFLRWRRILSPEIEVVPIELAGRGGRLGERLAVDARVAAADVATQILSQRRSAVPYTIWGHSMGSLIAYEAYYELCRQTDDVPGHLVFSGRTPPHVRLSKFDIFRIPNDDSFIAAVDSYGGGTKQAMEESGLREIFLPVLRADFELSESYEWSPKETPINCGVSIVNGNQDASVDLDRVGEWKDLVDGPVSLRSADGDHFFLYSNNSIVSSVVKDVHSALMYAKVNTLGKDTP